MAVIDINHLIAHIQRTDPKLWLALKNIWEAALKEGSITSEQLGITIPTAVDPFNLQVNGVDIGELANLNDDSPVTPFGFGQVFFQRSGSNVSAYASLNPTVFRNGALIGGLRDSGNNYQPFSAVNGGGVLTGIPMPIGGYFRSLSAYINGSIAQGARYNFELMCDIQNGTGSAFQRISPYLNCKPTDVNSIVSSEDAIFRVEQFDYVGGRTGVSFGIGATQAPVWSGEFIGDDDVCPMMSCFGGTTFTVGAGLTRYISLWSGDSTNSLRTIEDEAVNIVPVSGSLKRLFIVTSSAQPGDAEMTFTIRVNGVDKTLTVTVPAGGGSANDRFWIDFANSDTITQGSRFSIKVVNNSASASASIRSIGLLFYPTSEPSTRILGGHLNNTAWGAGTTQYITPLVRSWGTTEAVQNFPVPRTGTLRNLYVRKHTNGTAGTSTTFTVRKNGSDTVVTGSVTGDGSLGTYGVDLTNSVTVARGDYITLKAVQNGATGALFSSWCLEWFT